MLVATSSILLGSADYMLLDLCRGDSCLAVTMLLWNRERDDVEYAVSAVNG